MKLYLSTYLQKEWLDQRAGAARLATVLVLLAMAALALPRPVAGDPLFVGTFVGAALCAYALSIGSDLLAGELARGRVAFLERLPGGLSAAFAGKLCFFVLTASATALFGLALALGVSMLRTGALPDASLAGPRPELVLAGGALLAWTLATSAWLPRSALSLPVALVLLGALGWPLFLWLRVSAYRPYPGELGFYLLSSVVGAPVSAWASFAFGYARGGGARRALGVGLSVAALALLPAWSVTAVRAWAQLAFDPHDPRVETAGAIVSANERFAYLTFHREERDAAGGDGRPASVPYAVVVDLSDGSFEARRGASFDSGHEHSGVGARVVCRRASDGGAVWLDADTGAEIQPPAQPRSLRGLPTPEELGLPASERVLSRAGQGFRLLRGYVDPFRGRTFDAEELEQLVPGLVYHRVRAGEWAVHAKEPDGARRWSLLDPERGTLRSIPGLLAEERVGAVADDGRLVVSGPEGAFLLDPSNGARRELELPSELQPGPEGAPVWLMESPFGGAPAAVLCAYAEKGVALVRLDVERGALRLLGCSDSMLYLGRAESGREYALADGELVVLGAEAGERLFPR